MQSHLALVLDACQCTIPDFSLVDAGLSSSHRLSSEVVESTIHQIRAEKERRSKTDDVEGARRTEIALRYEPRFPHVRRLDETVVFSSRFLALVRSCEGGKPDAQLFETPADGVYTFDCFSAKFCDELLDELRHFARECQDLKGQPNSMNRYANMSRTASRSALPSRRR